jgi:transmembrane sensor
MRTDWTLIAKALAGEAGDEELKRLNDWRNASDENKQTYNMLKKNWDSPKYEDKPLKVDVDKAWMSLHDRLEREQLIPDDSRRTELRTFFPRYMQFAAAAVLLLALGTTAWLVLRSPGKNVRMTAATQEEQKFGLSLPDGSRVDMNAHSRLSYRQTGAGVRTVQLEGEAWFDVKHNESSPFVIRAGEGTIRVTGTSFSVRTGGDRTAVYVESGHVQFYRSRRQEGTLSLEAGQMGVLENDRLSLSSDIDPNQLAWKTRKLVFRDTPLGDVAGVLNRTYNRDIRFEKQSLEDCLFTGTFDQEPLDSVVRVIQVAFGFQVGRDGKAYVFSGDGCQ